jgi:hypothetical protein
MHGNTVAWVLCGGAVMSARSHVRLNVCHTAPLCNVHGEIGAHACRTAHAWAAGPCHNTSRPTDRNHGCSGNLCVTRVGRVQILVDSRHPSLPPTYLLRPLPTGPFPGYTHGKHPAVCSHGCTPDPLLDKYGKVSLQPPCRAVSTSRLASMHTPSPPGMPRETSACALSIGLAGMAMSTHRLLHGYSSTRWSRAVPCDFTNGTVDSCHPAAAPARRHHARSGQLLNRPVGGGSTRLIYLQYCGVQSAPVKAAALMTSPLSSRKYTRPELAGASAMTMGIGSCQKSLRVVRGNRTDVYPGDVGQPRD